MPKLNSKPNINPLMIYFLKGLNVLLRRRLKKYTDNNFKALPPKDFPNLRKIFNKYNGFCDLMCNYLTVNKFATPEAIFNNFAYNDDQFMLSQLEKLSKTHILSIAKTREKIKFAMFKRIFRTSKNNFLY